MLVRSNRLPKNQSAGRLDETPLANRPPKAAKEHHTKQNARHQRQHQINVSFIIYPPVLPASPCLPWPPNARHSNSR